MIPTVCESPYSQWEIQCPCNTSLTIKATTECTLEEFNPVAKPQFP